MKRLGIDIGSTTVKVAVIDEEHNILFSEYKRHFANIKETLKELVEHASKELGNVEVAPTITGSGGLALAQVLYFLMEVLGDNIQRDEAKRNRAEGRGK